MATRTLAQLRAAMIEDMKLNPGLIVTSERDRFLNRALLDLSDMNLFEKEVDITTDLDGTIAYPEDFKFLVYIKEDGKEPLKVMPSGVRIPTGGTPLGYVPGIGKLLIYPKPSSSVTLKLAYIYRLPSLVNENDIPDLPGSYDDLLVDFAVALCHRKNGNMGIYREYMGMYNVGKESLRAELVTRLNTRINTMQNSSSAVNNEVNPFDFNYTIT